LEQYITSVDQELTFDMRKDGKNVPVCQGLNWHSMLLRKKWSKDAYRRLRSMNWKIEVVGLVYQEG